MSHHQFQGQELGHIHQFHFQSRTKWITSSLAPKLQGFFHGADIVSTPKDELEHAVLELSALVMELDDVQRFPESAPIP